MYQMCSCAGFFPATEKMLSRFCEMMLEDSSEVDLLGSWLRDEWLLEDYMSCLERVSLLELEPFWSEKPWSRILKDKKVLVIHPFDKSIRLGYEKRELLFDRKEILPTFQSLQVIKAVQSLGGEDGGFKNWFEALDSMKRKIDEAEYDICLIGCGAYGFPLAAHVKRSGRQAVHLGGALQLLFGIKGSRWMNPSYGGTDFDYLM